MHEPLTNLRKVLFLQFVPNTPKTEIWRGLYGAMTLQAQCGKIIVAVSEDIDGSNADAIFWSLAYRCNPIEDMKIVPYRSGGHGPKSGGDTEESSLLVDATLKFPMPPLALPSEGFMRNAQKIWEELDLPRLTPQPPWHGYSLGDWSEAWQNFADNAAKGDWAVNGLDTYARRRSGLKPETPVRSVERNDGAGKSGKKT